MRGEGEPEANHFLAVGRTLRIRLSLSGEAVTHGSIVCLTDVTLVAFASWSRGFESSNTRYTDRLSVDSKPALRLAVPNRRTKAVNTE